MLTKSDNKPLYVFGSWKEAEEAYYSFEIHSRACTDDPDKEEAKIEKWLLANDLEVND